MNKTMTTTCSELFISRIVVFSGRIQGRAATARTLQ